MFKFEMGLQDVRKGGFDHHSGDQTFILKMASVQVMEWMVCTGKTPSFAPFVESEDKKTIMIGDFQLCHIAHFDEMILFAIPWAKKLMKMHSLYKFACTLSCIDSLGPMARKLLPAWDRDQSDWSMGTFNRDVKKIAEERGISIFEVPLIDKAKIMDRVAKDLVFQLNPMDIEEDEDEEKETDYTVLHDDGKLIVLEGDGTIPCHCFYKKGFECVVRMTPRDGKGFSQVAISIRTAFDGDLKATVLPAILELEKGWGGHTGIIGSPRPEGTRLATQVIIKIIKEKL